jgi:outer membrane protein
MIRKLALTMMGAAGLTAAIGVPPASAADIAPMVTKAAPPPAVWNPWMIRLRALVVDPKNDVTFDQLPGGDATWSTSVVPELDITYFFTPNFAAELILGVTRHKATGTGIVSSGVATGLNMQGLPIGKTWLLPPTLTLQYHATNFGAFSPMSAPA